MGAIIFLLLMLYVSILIFASERWTPTQKALLWCCVPILALIVGNSVDHPFSITVLILGVTFALHYFRRPPTAHKATHKSQTLVYTVGDAQDALATYYVGLSLIVAIPCIPLFLYLNYTMGGFIAPWVFGFAPALIPFIYGATKGAKLMQKTLDAANSEIES